MKQVFRALDAMSPSEWKLASLPRLAGGLYNFAFNEYGQLVKRSGYTRYNETALHTSRITGLHRYYPLDPANREFLAACNGTVYKLGATAPHAGTSIKSGLSATADVSFCNYGDRCYFVNGSDGVFKYNRTTCYAAGITPPANPPTGSAASSGSLSTGNYKARYTFVDSDGYESNPSPASDNIAVTAGQKIDLTVAVSADPKVTARRIYRTSANGALFYYDTQLANNSGTSVSLTQADTTLAQGSVLDEEHDAPPADAHLIARRRSRLLLAAGDAFHISWAATPEYWPADWVIYTGGRKRITGMMEQQEWLPVFTEDTIERLTGQDEDNYEFQNTYSVEGCIAPRSLVNCNNLLLYLGVDGVYAFDGTGARIVHIPLAEYLKTNLNPAYAHLAAGAFFNSQYLLSYPKGDSAVNSETVYLDFRSGLTGVYSCAFGAYCRWDQSGDGLRMFAGSASEGRVYEAFTGLSDDGGNIAAYDRVEPLDMGAPDVWKQFYNLYVKIKSTTATTLTMGYTLDDGTEQTLTTAIPANRTQWYKLDLPGGGQRGRAIALRPQFADKYAVTIMGYQVVYEPEAVEWA